MRKMDGLKIDFLTGDAAINFPAEFIGQSPQFKVLAIGYWILAMENERDELAKIIDAASKRTLKVVGDYKTIEEMLDADQVLIFMSKPHPVTQKKFVVTFANGVNEKKLIAYESCGYKTFRQLTYFVLQSNSVKTTNVTRVAPMTTG